MMGARVFNVIARSTDPWGSHVYTSHQVGYWLVGQDGDKDFVLSIPNIAAKEHELAEQKYPFGIKYQAVVHELIESYRDVSAE